MLLDRNFVGNWGSAMVTSQKIYSPTDPDQASKTPCAMTVAQIDQALRDFILQDTAHLRRDAEIAISDASQREPEAQQMVSEFVRQMAGTSLTKLDERIVDLSQLRDFLHAESERIKLEISGCGSTTLQSAQQEVLSITSRNGKEQHIVYVLPSEAISQAQKSHRRHSRPPPRMSLSPRNDLAQRDRGCFDDQNFFGRERLPIDRFMEEAMRATLEVSALIAAFFLATWPWPASAQTAPPPEQQQPAFTSGELASADQQFFGTVSRGLASLIERAVGQWGLPNGYVLGEEAGGAFFGGLRYGDEMLYTKNAAI
jgi:hypothetical protein